MLRARMRAAVEVPFQTRAPVAELRHQPIDHSREFLFSRRHRVIAMRVADTSDRRRVKSVDVEWKTQFAHARNRFVKARLRNSGENKILAPRQPDIAPDLGRYRRDRAHLAAAHQAE